MFAQAKRDLAAAKDSPEGTPRVAARRTTPPADEQAGHPAEERPDTVEPNGATRPDRQVRSTDTRHSPPPPAPRGQKKK